MQFDDTLKTDYSKVLPILEEYDIEASTVINPGYLDRTVGGRDRLSTEQLDRLHDAGWDICNHGMNHTYLSTLSYANQQQEIMESYDWLFDHGYSTGAQYLAYPFAAYNQDTIEIVSAYHTLSFDSGWPADGRAANPWLFHRSNADPAADAVLPNIELAAEYGGITTFYYHELTDEREQAFKVIINRIASMRDNGKIQIKPVREVDSLFFDTALLESS